MPITFWCTVLGGFLSLLGGFAGKVFTEYRDQLAKDRQTLQDMHYYLAGIGTYFSYPNGELIEKHFGKNRGELELEVRHLSQNVRCKKYRALAVEAGLLDYQNNNNCQYMLKKLRAAINPKYFQEMKNQHQKAVNDGRAVEW